MSELKVIYLGPACQEQGDGREWCQDDVWQPCECGHTSVKFVASTELDRVTAERDALQQRLNAADQRIDELNQERESLIAYGRNNGLHEASTVCSRMAYDTYYPAGSRFKHFVPKALEQQGNLLIKAANAIAALPDGPIERHRARQQKKAEKSATA
ncbi:hypothetical protein [Pseudomonas sp. S49]|uniref:hypothetical protein n=1 Tax=Pseudomonas sp. S49 TaxID=1573720 RepID=UPI00135B0ACF|nr:hypothetical protein [Pseudomonas sp. S49]